MPGICLSLADAPQELTALSHYWALIRREFGQNLAGREQTLALLAQAVFTLLLRNTALEDSANSGVRGELQLFQRFNKMVDERFREHLPVPEYAQALGGDRIAAQRPVPALRQPAAQAADLRSAAARGQTHAAVQRLYGA